MKLYFIILPLFQIVNCLTSESNNVVELKSAAFEPNDLIHSNWMIFLGSPQCPYCLKFLPLWKLFADVAKKDNINTAAVNCLTDISICQYFSVDKYPQILFIKNGLFYEFAGQRNLQKLVAFYNKDFANFEEKQVIKSQREFRKESKISFWPIYFSFNATTFCWAFLPILGLFFSVLSFLNVLKKLNIS